MAFRETDMALPRVLLLGDSIRLSYQGVVAALLAGQVEVVFPGPNGGDTPTTLGMLAGWLEAFGPDAVHFNNGLHDVKLERPARVKHQVDLPAYRANLETIAGMLLARCPGKVAWGTTTPVVEAWHQPVKDFDRLNADIDAYNAAAREVMAARGIAVTDLHAVVMKAGPERLLLKADGVHYNDAGRARLGEAVAAAVRRMMGVGVEMIGGD